MKTLELGQRLIIAADYHPDQYGRRGVKGRVLSSAATFGGLGATIKVNSALRASGYELIDLLHALNVGVFADLKLDEIKTVLATDGALLREVKPDLLTVKCSAGQDSMMRLKLEVAPETKVLGVGVLTTFKEADVRAQFGSRATIKAVQRRFFLSAKAAQLDGIICAPAEARWARRLLGKEMLIYCPNMRFADEVVPGDDQNPQRSMSPGDTVRNGANGGVMGRPITGATDPREAAERAIEEMRLALA